MELKRVVDDADRDANKSIKKIEDELKKQADGYLR